MKELKTNILIVGAGLTGLLAAYSLSKLKLNIVLLDKFGFMDEKSNFSDMRTTAIAEGSKVFLEKNGIWKKLAKYTEPIKNIRVLDRSMSNSINFTNMESKGNLGYIVKNSFIKKIIIKELKKKKNIKLIPNSQLIKIENNQDYICCDIKNIRIKSSLLIAADGKNSFVRNCLKTPAYQKKYIHKAIVINFFHNKDHKNIAHELFFKTGPLAILPMKSDKKNLFASSVIWSNKSTYINSLQNLNKKMLLAILQENIKKYVGNIIHIENVKSFNLSAHINHKFYEQRLIYVGDSAHSIHPIAGQGWNIGVRDIESCFNILEKNLKLGIDLGSESVCKNYHNLSFYDSYSLFQITDKLNSIFLNEDLLSKFIREQGFSFINNRKKIKNFITKFAMGL